MATYQAKVCDKELSLNKTRATAIKAYCTDCSGGQRGEVAECPCKLCPLYPFRGYISWNKEKKRMSEEDKAKVRERFAKARQDKKINE